MGTQDDIPHGGIVIATDITTPASPEESTSIPSHSDTRTICAVSGVGSSGSEELDVLRAEDAGIEQAFVFSRTFIPKLGVDYSWVVDRVEEQREFHFRNLDAIDAKATAIANFLAGGTGLFTLGSLAVLATASIPSLVILAVLPAAFAALAALVLATIARLPRGVLPIPTMADAARYAVADYDNAALAAAAFATQINLSVAVLKRHIRVKSWYVYWASWAMLASVVFLLVPLVVSLCVSHHK